MYNKEYIIIVYSMYVHNNIYTYYWMPMADGGILYNHFLHRYFPQSCRLPPVVSTRPFLPVSELPCLFSGIANTSV